MYSSTLTQKGQATIPVNIRKKLKIKPGTKVLFEEKDDQVIVRAAPDFFSLKGSIKSKIKYTDKKANKVLNRMFAEEYKKENVKTN